MSKEGGLQEGGSFSHSQPREPRDGVMILILKFNFKPPFLNSASSRIIEETTKTIRTMR